MGRPVFLSCIESSHQTPIFQHCYPFISCRLNLQLTRRIEYLSLAVSNAKSTPNLTTKSENGEIFSFLTDLEEKLEVAQVQIEVLQNVLDLSDDQFDLNNHHNEDRNAGPTKEDVVQVLQSRLLTISEVSPCPFANTILVSSSYLSTVEIN